MRRTSPDMTAHLLLFLFDFVERRVDSVEELVLFDDAVRSLLVVGPAEHHVLGLVSQRVLVRFLVALPLVDLLMNAHRDKNNRQVHA